MKRLTTSRPRRLSLPQAAAYLDVNPQTLRVWVKKGYIHPRKSPSESKFGGRYTFTREQLDDFEAKLSRPVPQASE